MAEIIYCNDIDIIIDKCNKLLHDDELEVRNFGKNADLILYIQKDSEFDPDVDEAWSNIVDITTEQNDEYVDDAIGIYVTDGQLYRELERIQDYRNFELIY